MGRALWFSFIVVMGVACGGRQHEERVEVVVVYQGPSAERRDVRVPLYLRRSALGAHYSFRDAALFSFADSGYRSLELPDHSWLRLLPLGYAPDGRLRLEVLVMSDIATAGDPHLGTTALLAQQEAMAIGGQPYLQGNLLVSLTRL